MARLVPFLLAVTLAAAMAPAARAADPIMPLAEVRPGMSCTGLSVVEGTAISEFDVEVLDVISAEAPLTGPRILVRVSGPAVDATGVGPGFSGSPLICDGRNAGAISEGIGEYGNHVVLATPIEEILADAPAPTPARARSARRIARRARPLAAPLTASGLGPRTRRLLERAAGRRGLALLASPGGPLGGYPPAELRPGAAVAANLASGDVGFGAVGTVSYRDGDRVWAFGHALDGIGRRALFLQDAYVFSVIGNPFGLPEAGLGTYKLTTGGGHTLGAVTHDGLSSISGAIGAEPPSVPLRIVATADGRTSVIESKLADERALGHGAGMGLVGPLAASTALERLLRSLEPVRVRMCVRFGVSGRRRPLGFCNRYFGDAAALADLSAAASLVDGFDLPVLPLTGMTVRLRVERGVPRDLIVDASAPRRARPGRRVRVALRVRRRGSGAARTVAARVRVPRSLRPGVRTLTLRGSGGPGGGEFLDEIFGEFLIFLDFESGPAREPRTVAELARRLRALREPPGIRAQFGRRGEERLVLRSDEVAFEGRARVRLRVGRATPRR